MQRYFKDTDLNIFDLSNDDSYHITKVMRNKIGEKIWRKKRIFQWQ